MIGHFKSVASAAKAMRIVERIREQVYADVKAGLMSESSPPQRFTDHIMELFREVDTYIIAPAELSQFNYDFLCGAPRGLRCSDYRGIRRLCIP